MPSQWQIAKEFTRKWAHRYAYVANEARWIFFTDTGEIDAADLHHLYNLLGSVAERVCEDEDVPPIVRERVLSLDGLNGAFQIAGMSPGFSTAYCPIATRRSKAALAILQDRIAAAGEDGVPEDAAVSALEALLKDDDRTAWKVAQSEAQAGQHPSEIQNSELH